MRPQIRAFVEACARHLDIRGPVVEIGAKRHPSQERLANLRPAFPGHEFIGCDMDAGPGVDRIENLEKLSFAEGGVGTFVLCDTLEHVRDLERAFGELDRCLDNDAGLLIATSVMLFPVHGFPNDYWRFTPEGFRELGKRFAWCATFLGGDPLFPHSVALVAARRAPDQAAFAALRAAAGTLTPVPHYPDKKSDLANARLAQLLIEQTRASGYVDQPGAGAMYLLSSPAWTLTPGTWMKIALPAGCQGTRIDLFMNGAGPIQSVPRSAWNVLVEADGEDLPETAFQFDPAPGTSACVGQLEFRLLAEDGASSLLARSALGVLLPDADLPRGFSLHAVDERGAAEPSDPVRARADALVRKLREQGTPISLDLGCGFRKAGSIGIDATAENTDADLICLLGFDPLPFADDSVDEVACRDFLEHIPKAVFVESERRLRYPVMYLMDEIWRVLKPGGMFRSWTPMYPHPEVFQDPTHLSAWTIKSMDYFCGLYPGAKRIYKIQANFEKVLVREENFYLYAELRKPIPDSAEDAAR